MASFRLKMATQLGEKHAREFGYTKFPVKPFEIAKKKDISIEAKPPELKGVSGAMIFAGGEARIIYFHAPLVTSALRISSDKRLNRAIFCLGILRRYCGRVVHTFPERTLPKHRQSNWRLTISPLDCFCLRA